MMHFTHWISTVSFFCEGDWHQYDDIVCVEPSKNVLKRVKEKIWPEQRKNLIEGRGIAGNIMLESIFDLLRSWTDTNLTSFLIQLNQFCQVYGEPFVYEEKQKKWGSLNYGEEDVSLYNLHAQNRDAPVEQPDLLSLCLWYNFLGEADDKGIHAEKGDSSVAEGW